MLKKIPNVLFLASWFPNKTHPTVGNFIQRHAEVANTIANVYVLFALPIENQKSKFDIQNSVENDVYITRVYYRKVMHKIPLVHTFLKYKRYRKAMKVGEQTIGKKFDFLHVNTFWFAGLAALDISRSQKISYLITEHWSGFLPQNNAFESASFVMKTMTKRIFRKAKFVLPVSDDLGKSLQSRKLIDEFHCLANVVDTTLFKPNPTTKNEVYRFIHISTIDEAHKNFSGLLEAFSKVKYDFILEIITDGDLTDAQRKINAFGLSNKIELRGSSTQEEVAEALQQANCLVQFSNVETFSIVIAEAWSSGIPCVYTKCGGLTNIVNDKLGFQIERGDVQGLQQKIEDFIQHQYEFDQQYIRSFAIEMFSEQKVRQQLDAVYKKM